MLSLLFVCFQAIAGITAEHYKSLKAGLDQPTDTAISHNGDIYVLNGTLGQVIVFSERGKQKFIFGQAGKDKYKLNLPMGIAIENNRVYIADTGNQRIVVFDLQGKPVHKISLKSDRPVAPVSLLIMDKNIVWSDRENHQLCVTQISNGKMLKCWGEKGEADGQFYFPFQLVVDEQNYIHVVDVLNSRVQIFSRKGRHFMNIARFGIDQGSLFRPNGLALYKDNNLLVSDAYFGNISVFKNGKAFGFLTAGDGSILKFKTPAGLTIWKDKLYVTDTLNNSIEIFKLNKSDKQPIVRPDSNMSRKNCITCHISWADNYLANRQQPEIAPVAHQQMCYSCHHGVVIDSRISIGHKEQHPDIHHERDKKESDKKSKDKVAKNFPLTRNKKLYCGSCHTPHNLHAEKSETLYEKHNNSWMRQSNNGGELCLQCHKSMLDNVQHDKRPEKGKNHPVGIYLKQPPVNNNEHYAKDKNLHNGLPEKLIHGGGSLNRQQQMICQSCHQIHGSDEEQLTVTVSADSEICHQCHQRHYAKDLKSARKKGIHPVNIKLDKPVKINNREVKVVDCLTCHSPHNGKPDTPLLIMDYKNGGLCNVCHEDYNKIVKTDHDLRLTAAESKNHYNKTPEQAGVCENCHSMHQPRDNVFSLDATELHAYKGKEKPLPRDRICLNCHRKKGRADKAQIKYFSHPVKNMILRSDKKQMPLLDKDNKINEFGKIACITCHNPHRWSVHKSIENELMNKTELNKNDAGNVTNSFLHSKDIASSFCKDCHGIETQIKYKYYHLELSRQ